MQRLPVLIPIIYKKHVIYRFQEIGMHLIICPVLVLSFYAWYRFHSLTILSYGPSSVFPQRLIHFPPLGQVNVKP